MNQKTELETQSATINALNEEKVHKIINILFIYFITITTIQITLQKHLTKVEQEYALAKGEMNRLSIELSK